MGKFVLIGGGIFPQTTPFLQASIDLAAKTNPKILIIPTAGADNKQTFAIWRDLYASLGGHATPLYLIKNPPALSTLEKRILNTDIIYVPGGDTLHMLQVWRKLGVDKALRKAHRGGIVLAGRSAGANCWFSQSIGAELNQAKRGRFFHYRQMRGLGLLEASLCTHYQGRKEAFRYFLERFGGVGIGLENNQALIIRDGRYRLLNLEGKQPAYKLYTRQVHQKDYPSYTQLCEEPIRPTAKNKPLDQLLTHP